MDKSEFDILWKQYEDNVNLYKFYLDIALRVIVLYAAVIGGIFSFFVVHQDTPYIKWVLSIPIFLSVFLSIYAMCSIKFVKVIEEDFIYLTEKMNQSSYPTTTPLIVIMYISSTMFSFISIGLLLAIIFI